MTTWPMSSQSHNTRRFEIDEVWLAEWFEWGYADLCAYLARWAPFMQWCHEHNREEGTP